MWCNTFLLNASKCRAVSYTENVFPIPFDYKVGDSVQLKSGSGLLYLYSIDQRRLKFIARTKTSLRCCIILTLGPSYSIVLWLGFLFMAIKRRIAKFLVLIKFIRLGLRLGISAPKTLHAFYFMFMVVWTVPGFEQVPGVGNRQNNTFYSTRGRKNLILGSPKYNSYNLVCLTSDGSSKSTLCFNQLKC